MPRIKKTSLTIEVTDSEYHVKYTGTLIAAQTKEERKHNERLMRALLASDELLTFCYNIVMPVVRNKRREARKEERVRENWGALRFVSGDDPVMVKLKSRFCREESRITSGTTKEAKNAG